MRIKRRARPVEAAMVPGELQRLRVKVLKMSQRELAEALGLTVVTISRWETGATPIREWASIAVHTLVERFKEKAKQADPVAR